MTTKRKVEVFSAGCAACSEAIETVRRAACRCCGRRGSGRRCSVPLTTGKTAGLAGVSADTVRYYERERLIAPAAKSEGGHRLYDRDAIRRIGFIKQSQQCGFTLADIRALL